MKNLPTFQKRACSACKLRDGCQTPCIPTSAWGQPSGKSKALLIVGEAPGFEEDLVGKPFVGVSGRFLSRMYIKALGLDELADIYLTNAVRCRPVGNATPTKSQITHCRNLLTDDIGELQEHYAEVVVLCAGGAAAQSLLSCSLGRAFARQGSTQLWGWAGTEGLKPVRVWSTFHPANLLNKRNPTRLAAIRDHLRLLEAHLAGRESTLAEVPLPDLCPDLPNYPIERLSIDVETYGAIEGQPPQTVFHPLRSIACDGVGAKDLVVTACCTWRDPAGEVQTAGFQMWRLGHRARLASFCRKANSLVGQNIKFDILYLWACDPQFLTAIPYGKPLVELSVLNYLHSEQRPERSLKALAPLLGITEYDAATSLSHFRYPSREDPRLLAYNAKDTFSTLRAVELLETMIARDYPDSDKLSDYSRQWYTRLLWCCIRMEHDGVAFDGNALSELDFRLVLEAHLLYIKARDTHGLILSGKGSAKSTRELYVQAVEAADLIGDRRIELTDKKHDISCNQHNANVLLEALPLTSPIHAQLKLQQEFERLNKLVTSYSRPLLHGTDKKPNSSRLIEADGWGKPVHIAYPSWFPVPSAFDQGEGGTMQGRITSKFPACQVLPKEVKAVLTSRYRPGFLIGADLSQIELRVGALLSGDPLMMQEYQEGVDRHSVTGRILIKAIVDVGAAVEGFTPDQLTEALSRPSLKGDFDLFRQAGKTTNFLILYQGGGFKLRATLANDLGVDLPLEVCEEVVDVMNARYRVFAEWQEALLKKVAHDRRLVLPLTGQSRLFLGSPRVILDTYTSEICNMPVQCIAAGIMLDIQADLRGRLDAACDRKVYMGLNVYDAIYLDGPLSEYDRVSTAVAESFQAPDYYNRLCAHLHRTLPLGYDVTVYSKDRVPGRRLGCQSPAMSA